ncbi:hypothetical protein GTA08_BOTSDO13117 [Neofusicoccum parvum]|uniref:Uncharacterized protein n=1 Tax=Neofusicoccum parvum TaxID=310453 RepID=A0ACB5RTP0_9PEZI|nr:hypothetical protein GTA08_BOTSDO13117 [Neofusicoccum parvum]
MAVLDPEIRSLETLLNHIVLPERLPSGQGDDTSGLETELTDVLIHATEALANVVPDPQLPTWDDVRGAILVAKELNNNGAVGGLEKLSMLPQSHIVEFEAFEASAKSRDVLAAESALQWRFPGAEAAVPFNTFADDSFQQNLADFLEQCSGESFEEFAAHARKAGADVVETRDTADPALVSQLLMTILEAYGCRLSPPLLHKRVRDDVVWEAGAETPWRRSAYWLVLRVGLARYLDTTYGPEAGRVRYKLLICVVLAQLLRRSTGVVSVELLCNLRAKLARRLSKLEADRIKCPPSAVDINTTVFPALGPFFHDTLKNATDHINATWNAFKRTIQRPAHTLPCRADRSSLRLRLPNSGEILESILASPSPLDDSHHHVSFDINGDGQASRSFFDRYSRLSAIEQEVTDGIFEGRLNGLSDEKACMEISAAIERYLEDVGSAYDGLPEMQSAKVLTVMDMWTMMDERATTEIGLLLDYSPTVPAAALDVLQLPSRAGMCRLQRIQDYLQSRAERAGASAPTIFDNPSKRCFAVRYYNECDDSNEMAKLNQRIETQAEGMRKKKTKE